MNIGRALIIAGLVLVIIGVLFTLGARLPLRIGRLPGDIVIRGRHSVFYLPLMTSILISLILTLVLWLLSRR